MANPLVAQGSLNRLRASVSWATFPALNVTAPYLGKRAISIAFAGDSVVYIDTMTGAVTSPEPYLRVNVTMNLLRTQALANAYKLQLENDALLGGCTVRPDAAAMNPWTLHNCSIMSVSDMSLAGDDASYAVRIGGIYYVNSALFSG